LLFLLLLLLFVDFFHRQFLQGTRDVDLLEDLIFEGLLCRHCLRGTMEKGCKVIILVICGQGKISDKIESLLDREGHESLALEEIIDVPAVTSQKVKGHRVVMLDGLRDIDYPHLLLIVKHVVLGEVAVD